MFSKFFKRKCFQSFFLHTKVCFQKCFLQKDTCFSKQNVFKNTFTTLILPKNVFFHPLKGIKIYLLKKCFYHVKKMFVLENLSPKPFSFSDENCFFFLKRFLRKQFLLPHWAFLKIKNKNFLNKKNFSQLFKKKKKIFSK